MVVMVVMVTTSTLVLDSSVGEKKHTVTSKTTVVDRSWPSPR